LKQQDSFSDVLAQLEADAESVEYAQGGGREGEADGQRKIGHIETSAAWPRPALGKWNAQSDKIGKHHCFYRSYIKLICLRSTVFQQIDIDESTDPTTGSTLRLFGLTKKGNSVLLHVHGFKPYFYVAAPKDFMTEDCRHLKDQLNVSVGADTARYTVC
jgi:DNA polymerase delta subunit 1